MKNRRDFWNFSNYNGIRSHHQLSQATNTLTIQPNWLNDWVFVYKLSSCGFESCCSYWKILCFDIDRYFWNFSNYNGIRSHHQLSQATNTLTIQPNWLNDWVFVYKLSSCGFESCCSYWKILCFDIDRYLLHLDLKKQKQRVEDLKLNRNSLQLNNYIFLI